MNIREYFCFFYQKALVGFRSVYYPLRFGIRIRIHPTTYVSNRAILRCRGGGLINIGPHCEIGDYAIIDTYGGYITMGSYCSLNPFCVLYGHGGVRIGNGVRIASHSVIIPANHNFRSIQPLRLAGTKGKGIQIEDNVWIGSGSRILDGVTIGQSAVVGAGAVVTRSVAARCIATGVPARAKAYHIDKLSQTNESC